MDTIYKDYPFGALLFWRTNEKLKVERDLGPFKLPEPKADYPIDYVLDGQQRITSVYATFQTKEGEIEDPNWKDIYYDYAVSEDAQEPQFFALDRQDVDKKRHFPLRAVFDTTEYRRLTRNLDETIAVKIDKMQSKFKEASLPVQLFRTDEKSTVAVIFERINRQGVPLDTLQLLSAWTWSEDFMLQQQFEDLIDEIESKGFDPRNFDENLLLRYASAILVSNPRPEAIVSIAGEDVRKRFDEVKNGILGALDFLIMNLSIRRIENLPFQTILVPLSVFFALSGSQAIVVSQGQRDQILRWFWESCFERRYSSGVLRHLEEDTRLMLQLKGGQKSQLGTSRVTISPNFFLYNNFALRNVDTKTFILLLAQARPKSFISGTPIDLSDKLKEYNKTEFHHMMPRAYVRALKSLKYDVDCLANFCFLSRSENNHLGGDRPSNYKNRMGTNVSEILEAAICPDTLFADVFNSFIADRAKMLVEFAQKLVNQ